jgi:hypothetical protein
VGRDVWPLKTDVHKQQRGGICVRAVSLVYGVVASHICLFLREIGRGLFAGLIGVALSVPWCAAWLVAVACVCVCVCVRVRACVRAN